MAHLITEFLLLIVKLAGFGLLMWLPLIVTLTICKYKEKKRRNHE